MKLKELPLSLRTAHRLSKLKIPTLCSTDKPVIPVVVSLTSIPSRLKKLHLVIRSLLNQSYLPQTIVLWLHRGLKDHIPDSLTRLEGEFFQIRYSDIDCPHLKLVESLSFFPDHLITTCDDDLMYPQDWLEKLYVSHLQHPDEIITNECRIIRFDQQGNALPYKHWSIKTPDEETSTWLLPLGYGGVIYPPNSLPTETCDSQLYLKLSPKADDLWFKAMSYMKGTQSRRAAMRSDKPIPIAGTQGISLKKENVDKDRNRTQWQQLDNYFGLRK